MTSKFNCDAENRWALDHENWTCGIVERVSATQIPLIFIDILRRMIALIAPFEPAPVSALQAQ